jgi:nicotinate-nucleotide adenylyltransferase
MGTGILGGTFDPIHSGHLTIAGEARRRLGLDKIIFMPAGKPWLKVEREITPVYHRVNMVRLAIKETTYFELSEIEVKRSGPTYTVDTLQELHSELGPGFEPYFILGWDSLAEISLWKEPETIIKLCKLVAVTRANAGLPGLESLEQLNPGLTESTIILDIPPIDISSSDIRKRIAEGLPVKDRVPIDVEKYITKHRLYRGEE